MHTNAVPIQERAETVAFVWPAEVVLKDYQGVDGYVVERNINRAAFESVQDSIGWRVTDEQWETVLKEVVENSMVTILHLGLPIAIACGLARSDGWSELAWVAVSREHRGFGIGKMVSSGVVAGLLEVGKSKIYGSTQDERLSAISIYLDIGFCPLYRLEKVERWKSICQKCWGWQLDA
jgi:predicted GNAT family acetyltransferase